jgi:hypothetical protein
MPATLGSAWPACWSGHLRFCRRSRARSVSIVSKMFLSAFEHSAETKPLKPDTASPDAKNNGQSLSRKRAQARAAGSPPHERKSGIAVRIRFRFDPRIRK